jgi:hypothetical protein
MKLNDHSPRFPTKGRWVAILAFLISFTLLWLLGVTDIFTTHSSKENVLLREGLPEVKEGTLNIFNYDQYCTWAPNTSDCTNMLSNKLHHWSLSTGTPHLISKRWVFLGDSTMRFLFNQIQNQEGNDAATKACKCQRKVAPKCNMYDVFNLTKKNSNWTKPVTGMEGPRKYGLLNPHCQDCSGCNSVLLQCNVSPCNNYTTTSFLGVEYARDVEMQTDDTKTTQESMALFLRRQRCIQYPFICVVNTGHHDMAILDPNGTAYIENTARYFTLLQPCCRHLIRIQSTSTLDEKDQPQKNSLIELWNGKVKALLREERFQNWTSIIDPYNISMTWPHHDNVHLDESYYKALADLFVPLLLEGNLPND